MHILIIPSWYYKRDNPVFGSFFREQAHALKRAGHRVGVIKPERSSVKILRDGISRWPHYIEIENDNGIPTYRHHGMAWMPSIPKRKALHWYCAGRSLYKKYCLDQGTPDIIHAHCSLYAGFLGMCLKQTFQTPLVVTEHSTAFALKQLKPFEMNFAQKVFLAADVRIAVSPSLGKLLSTLFGDAFQPWTYIPNVLDNRFSADRIRIPGSHGKKAEFRWLNIGYLLKKKGQADLLKAFAKSFKSDKAVTLRIAGDGPLETELKELAATLGIADQVMFLGRIDRPQVFEELSQSDAFVLSSHNETFGVVIIEAMALGKPVVATACGGPEHIIEEAHGVLVPPQNVNALALAMHTLKTEISRFNPAAIRTSCIRRFGEELVVPQIEKAYADLLKPSAPFRVRNCK